MSIIEYFRRFDYYAKPEGHAPLDKVVGVTKYGLLTGLGFGFHDVFLISKTRTVLDTLRCFGFWMVPMGGMGAAFASTTYMSTNLRGKDDPLNYVFGAIAAGGVLHAWHKCGLTTLYGTIIMSIFAAAKKDSKQSGWTFFGDPPECQYDTPFITTASARQKKYERGWTK